MRILDRGTLFDASRAESGSRFCSSTSLERLSDGRLVVAFRHGSSKDSSDEDARVMLSEDEGASWSIVTSGFGTHHPSADGETGPPGRMRGLYLTEVSPGRILGAFTWIDRSDPSLTFANPDTTGILPSKLLVGESLDAGRTWDELREVSVEPHKAAVMTGEIVVLNDGTLALPYELWKDHQDTSYGVHRAALRFSRDSGETWPDYAIAAEHEPNRLFFWDQRISRHPQDGRLINLIWTHDREAEQDIAIHVTRSGPDAQSWEPPVSTGIAGQIAAPLVLPDGRVFAAYVHRDDPPSLRAMLSDDFGVSWTAAEELVFYAKQGGDRESGMGGPRDFSSLWDDMSRWTFGHPACRVLSGGEVMVAYYAGDSSAMGIHWVKIAVD